jgi:hypothetical protein
MAMEMMDLLVPRPSIERLTLFLCVTLKPIARSFLVLGVELLVSLEIPMLITVSVV